jgi:hypothetical protein
MGDRERGRKSEKRGRGKKVGRERVKRKNEHER